MAMMVLLLGLIVAGVLLAGFVLALTSETKNGRIFGVIAVLAVSAVSFLLCAGLTLAPVRVARQPNQASSSTHVELTPPQPSPQASVIVEPQPPRAVVRVAPPAAPAAEGVLPGTSNPAWTSTDADLFSITHFASIDATFRPIVKQLQKRLVERAALPGDDERDAQLNLVYLKMGDKETLAFKPQVIDAIKSVCPQTELRITDTVQPSRITLDFKVQIDQEETSAWDIGAIVRRGSVTCQAWLTGSESITVTKQFVEKPWVEAYDQFVTNHPHRRLIVGYSSGLQSTENAARQSAMADVQNVARSMYGMGFPIAAQESNVLDRFAQRLTRPYGDVWREAVLVEISDQQHRVALAVPEIRVVQQQRSWFGVVFSTGILTLMAAGLCVVLNWATEGYYRRRIAIVFGGFGLLLAVALWLVREVL